MKTVATGAAIAAGMHATAHAQAVSEGIDDDGRCHVVGTDSQPVGFPQSPCSD